MSSSSALGALSNRQPTIWENDARQPGILTSSSEASKSIPLSKDDLDHAVNAWAWFRPLFAHLFEEARHPPFGEPGTISSPLKQADKLAEFLALDPHKCYLKMDSHLAVCGSVKARGGMFEVVNLAARIGQRAKDEVGRSSNTSATECSKTGLFIPPISPLDLVADPVCKNAIAQNQVVVGSTGNLGLSVGLSAAALGMRSTVHMSVDAKQWKKDLLRQRGATVVEHEGLIDDAYAAGRKAAEADPLSHFIDDEKSKTLKLGYACAAFELKSQLEALNIDINEHQPLIVHVPCGVGGAPGGICWGLEHAFGDNACNVHTFFAEPVAAPCVTLALASGRGSELAVSDIGLDGKTEADGLAVGRAAQLVVDLIKGIVAGCYTVEDEELFVYLRALVEREGDDMFIEPSCCAGLLGPERMRATPKSRELADKGVHVFWATGGSLVPADHRQELLKKFLNSEPPAKKVRNS